MTEDQKNQISVEEEELVFNVEVASATKFGEFIDTALSKFDRTFLSNEDPYITLKTSSHKIKIRLDDDYFDLIGYHMEVADQWFEYGYHHTWRRKPPFHRIPGSTFLDMGATHGCVEGAAGLGHTMDNVLLGQQPLIAAVNRLAVCLDRREIACSLLVVVLMISESLRFPMVRKQIQDAFLMISPLPHCLLRMVRINVQYHKTTLDWLYKPEPKPNRYCNRMFKLKNRPIYELECNHWLPAVPREWRPVDASSGLQSLVEVFSVCIRSINSESSGSFYGSITVTALQRTQLIYNKKKEQSEFIGSSDNLLLTGPKACPCISRLEPHASFCFGINSNTLTWTDHIVWEGNRDGFDRPLKDEFVTDYCSVMLNFIVFKKAVQATVEVIVSYTGCGNDPAHVYGNIFARSSKFKDYEIMLFQKERKKYLDVSVGQIIELSRSVVAVPWESSLLIQVELYDHNGEEFSLHIAEFPSQLDGSSISNTSDRVQVRVIWP